MSVPASKRTFYPDPIVADALQGVRPKKLSERVNGLIRKGLEQEQLEKIRAEYARVDRELANAAPGDQKAKPLPMKWLAAERLFSDDDGSPEDLF